MTTAILDKTITISMRQVWRWTRWCLYLLFPFYLALIFMNSWDLKMGAVPLKASPYYLQVPVECRTSVMNATSGSVNGSISEAVLLKPKTQAFSLTSTESKLGFGMRGLPCMGWDFLTSLHTQNYVRVQKFFNADGDVVAVLTLEVKKPLHAELTREEWNTKHLLGWSGLDADAIKKDSGFIHQFVSK